MRSTRKMNVHCILTAGLCLGISGGISSLDAQAVSGGSKTTRPQLANKIIDPGSLVPLTGHVLKALRPDLDMGAVDDATPVRLYLNIQRTPAQQADLTSLLAAQQQTGSPSFHKWLTPEQFGERFGAAASDINKITLWLTSQGFEVTSVAKNASVINFKTTAGGVRDTFHVQLHNYNLNGDKVVAVNTEPLIPAALSSLVAGIAGLNQVPPHAHHTSIHPERYDSETHKWYPVASANADATPQPHEVGVDGNYNMTPQDFYTIYNVNPILQGNNVGAGSTIGIIGSGPFNYGTVSGGDAGGKASGGDVTTFHKLFGITTPVNLQIQHGVANFPCSGVGGTNSGESALDVEWASSLAPGATILFENCTDGNAFLTEVQALVDADVADVISSSVGFSEGLSSLADNQSFETLFAQAATQGQTVLSAQGDSGSDDTDFGSTQGTHGLSIDYPGSSPNVLSVGGTDFQDLYDVHLGSSIPQSTYWAAKNSQFYGTALSYVPETAWNDSCGSVLAASDPTYGGASGESTATYCNSTSGPAGQVFSGGGGGGLSTYFAQPTWQKGFPGLSAAITQRATPDVSLFSAVGVFSHHSLVVCDSGSGPASACTSPSTFGFAGGTSFAAPQFAGILGLLRTATNSRQGLVQPKLYSLAKAQYAAGTACYANGQSANAGITKSLPASSCIFHDVTTNSNNNECEAGTPTCFTNPGAGYGVMTSSKDTSIFVDAYAAGAKYDLATGLGSVNVTNLINGWNGTTPPPPPPPPPPPGCIPSAAGVKICTPLAGSNNPTSSPVTLSAGALAKAGNITAIRAYVDNVAVATVNNPAKSTSFSISQSVTAAVGSHHLVVVGYESTGASIQSDETFWISGGTTNCPPTTTGAMICSPGPNATVSSPVTINAGATVLTGGYITAIRVYVDNVAQTLVNNSAKSKSFVINQPLAIAKGAHKLVVVGYESTGGSVTATDSITVK